jgi:hypothetical protein
MIAIWGSREAGKTTFLISLYYEIVQRQKVNEGWKMFGADEDGYSDTFIERGFVTIGQEKQFPARTEVSDLRALRFAIEKPIDHHYHDQSKKTGLLDRSLEKLTEWLQIGMRREAQTDQIDFLDPSGEYFKEPKLLETDAGAVYRQALIDCDGLICLVDPTRQDGERHYFPLLYRNFAMLARLMRGEGVPGPLPIPVAVCVTKIDQFPNAQNDAREFLQQHMGDVDFGVFRTFCKDVAFFATSAIGMDNVREENGRFVPLGPPKPLNVLEPIEWLMSRGARPR